MSTEVEYLHLQQRDTVVTVRDRLSGLRGKRVLLIWPESDKILQRKLDLVLIQREAYRRAIQLAIVSQDDDLRIFAAELNISCFPTIDASRRERWKRGRHKVFLPRYHKPSADLLAEDLDFIASRLSRHNRHSPWRAIIERILVLALLFATTGAALYTVAPGAVVSITLQEEDITVVFDILADRKVATVDATKAVIPAETIRATVETNATIPTSGSVRLDSVSAAAIVTFTNLGEARISIPRGTILGTSAGEPILFETVADVSVPAGAGRRVDAAVEAMDSYRGSIGNVGPGMINTILGGLADRVSVINLASAAGGSNRSVKTVAVSDKDKLLDIVRIQLQSLAFEQMRANLSDSQVIIIESIKIDDERKEWTNYSADVGTMTSELSLSMRAAVSALAVDDRYGRQLLLERLKAAVPAQMVMQLDSVSYLRGPFVQSRADGQISFTVTGSATAIAKVDGNRLREQLAGKTLNVAREFLGAMPQVSDAQLSEFGLFPRAMNSLPLLAVRINVQIRD